MVFGAHCNGGIKGALDRAAEIGADAVQLFVQSPRAWRFPEHDRKDVQAFVERRQHDGIEAVFVHTLYLVNLATPDDAMYEKSVTTMHKTMEAACAIEAEGVVVHVGSHLGAGFDAGLERAVPALRSVLELCNDRTWLLLENSAGAGGTIGRSIDELAALFDALEAHPRLGVCLDSCHLFVSGIDVTDRSVLDATLRDLDGRIGLARLRVLHVNDSKAPLGSNRDRHDNVGAGLIGTKLGVFLSHPKLQKLPAVLETPGPDDHGPDAAEIDRARKLHRRWLKKT